MCALSLAQLCRSRVPEANIQAAELNSAYATTSASRTALKPRPRETSAAKRSRAISTLASQSVKQVHTPYDLSVDFDFEVVVPGVSSNVTVITTLLWKNPNIISHLQDDLCIGQASVTIRAMNFEGSAGRRLLEVRPSSFTLLNLLR